MEKLYLGIDIGGTYIKFSKVSKLGILSETNKIKTPTSYSELKIVISKIIKENLKNVIGIGISCPGRVNPDTGLISYGGTLPYLNEKSLDEVVYKEFSIPCNTINDGKAVVLAESWIGSLKDVNNGVAIVLGTGVGGGIVLNNQLVQGVNYQAGEFSFIYDTDDLLGMTASAVKFISKASNLIKVDECGETVFKEIENDNPKLHKIFQQYCYKIAVLINNIQATLDIEKVVIGGGISQQNILLTEINNQYFELRSKNQMLNDTINSIPIEKCTFMSDSNILGAVRNHMIKAKTLN